MRAATRNRLARLQREAQLNAERARKSQGRLRSAVLLAYTRDGTPAVEIGGVLGVSRQRVYQILGGDAARRV